MEVWIHKPVLQGLVGYVLIKFRIGGRGHYDAHAWLGFQNPDEGKVIRKWQHTDARKPGMRWDALNRMEE